MVDFTLVIFTLVVLITTLALVLIWFEPTPRLPLPSELVYLDLSTNKQLALSSITQPPTFDLSVIIPCYNEQKRLGAMLDKVFEWARTTNKSVEVVVVDDCSRDDTTGLAHRLGLAFVKNSKNSKKRDFVVIRLQVNRGKGGAVCQVILVDIGNDAREGKDALVCRRGWSEHLQRC